MSDYSWAMPSVDAPVREAAPASCAEQAYRAEFASAITIMRDRCREFEAKAPKIPQDGGSGKFSRMTREEREEVRQRAEKLGRQALLRELRSVLDDELAEATSFREDLRDDPEATETEKAGLRGWHHGVIESIDILERCEAISEFASACERYSERLTEWVKRSPVDEVIYPPAPPIVFPQALPAMSSRDLLGRFNTMRPTVIDGVVRLGEVCNIIAAPKVGKSWLVLAMALAVCTGRWWFNFPTTRGRVLMLDNELHAETSSQRLAIVAEAMGIDREEFADNLVVVNLRGLDMTVEKLSELLKRFRPGDFSLVIVDAWYRTIPKGFDENSNSDTVALYNLIDNAANRIGAAVAVVHHMSKGNQSSKSVTDTGAGAGAQARAADCHMAIREHEEAKAVVVDAASRSFPPMEKFCLRWRFPLWELAMDLDPELLKTERPRKSRENTKDAAPWIASRFAETFGSPEPVARAALLDDALAGGLTERKAATLVKGAVAKGLLYRWTGDRYATVAEPESDVPRDATPDAAAMTKRERVLSAMQHHPSIDAASLHKMLPDISEVYIRQVLREMSA